MYKVYVPRVESLSEIEFTVLSRSEFSDSWFIAQNQIPIKIFQYRRIETKSKIFHPRSFVDRKSGAAVVANDDDDAALNVVLARAVSQLGASSPPSLDVLRGGGDNTNDEKLLVDGGGVFPCDKCRKTFANYTSLRVHRGTVHGAATEFICEFCANSFKSRSTLSRHRTIIHADQKPTSYTKKCGRCDQKLPTMQALCQHLRLEHLMEIHVERLEFLDQKTYEEWRRDVQTRGNFEFVSRGSGNRHARKSYLFCHRSGVFRSKSKGRRAPKGVITNRINFDCSAFAIVFNRDDGMIEVTACLDHYGHENLPTPSRTPKRMKKRLEMMGKSAENPNRLVNCEDVQCRLLALVDLLPSLPLGVVEKFRTPVSRMEFMIENQSRSNNDDCAGGHSSSENEMTAKKRKARKPRKRSMDRKLRKIDNNDRVDEKIDNFCGPSAYNSDVLEECQDDDDDALLLDY